MKKTAKKKAVKKSPAKKRTSKPMPPIFDDPNEFAAWVVKESTKRKLPIR